MKKLCYSLILFLLSFYTSSAIHVIGNEITYQHVSGSNYQISLKVYVLCSDSSYKSTQRIKLSSSDTSSVLNVFLPLKKVESYSALCDSMRSGGLCKRVNGKLLSYDIYTYDSIINLSNAPFSSNTCNYRFSFLSDEYRMNSSSPSEKFFNYADLNRCYGSNSSVAYTLEPLVFYGYSGAYSENWGIIDSTDKKDSIKFSLVKYLTDSNMLAGSISYPSGITHLQPVKTFSGNGFSFDSILSGNMSFVPYQVSDSHFIVIETSEYRTVGSNRVLVGKTRRDVQYFISSAPIPNNNPSLQANSAFTVCGGSQLCFNISSSDPVYLPGGKNDTTKITWNRGIPPASIYVTDSTARLKSIRFCWTPDSSYEGTRQQFSVRVWDNYCPQRGFNSKAYNITVKKGIRNVWIKKTRIGCNRVILRAMYDSTFNKATSIQWSIKGSNFFGDTLLYQFPDSGMTLVNLLMNSPQNCPFILYDSVNMDSFLLRVNVGADTSLCYDGKGIRMNALVSKTTGQTRFSWNGSNSDTLSYLDFSYPNLDSFFNFSVTANDARGCAASDALNVAVRKRPDNTISLNGAAAFCSGSSVTLSGTIQTGLKFQWFLNDTQLIGSSYALNAVLQGKYKLLLNDTLRKCSNSADTLIIVHPRPKAKMGTSLTQSCFRNNQFSVWDSSAISSGSFNRLWIWSDGEMDSSGYSQHSFGSAGNHSVKLRLRSDKGCEDSLVQSLTLHPDPQARIVADSLAQCRNSNQFILRDSSIAVSYQRTWKYGSVTSIQSVLQLHFTSSFDSLPVELQLISNQGCTDTARTWISVYPNPLASFGINDSIQCLLNNSFQFTDSSTAASGNIIRHIWFTDGNIDSGFSLSKSYTAPGNFQVSLFIEDSLHCRDTLTRFVDVLPSPLKPVISRSGNTLFTGAYPRYEWYRNDTLLANDTSASVMYGIGGIYRVIVYNQYDCAASSDTVHFTPLGITKLSNEPYFMVFPNPASATFTISFSEAGLHHVLLLDISGRKVLELSTEGKSYTVNRQGLAAGIYFILVTNTQNVSSRVKLSLE